MEGTTQPGKEAASPGREGAAGVTGRLPSCPQESEFKFPITHCVHLQLPHQHAVSWSNYLPFAKETAGDVAEAP